MLGLTLQLEHFFESFALASSGTSCNGGGERNGGYATFVWQERARTRATQMTHMPFVKPLSKRRLIATFARHLLVSGRPREGRREGVELLKDLHRGLKNPPPFLRSYPPPSEEAAHFLFALLNKSRGSPRPEVGFFFGLFCLWFPPSEVPD